MHRLNFAALGLFVAVASCGVEEHPLGRRATTRPPTGMAGAGGSGGVAPGTGGTGGQPDAGVVADTGAPAPSGAGVTLDGQFVPREKIVAFIHIGHSNMAGRGEGPTDVRPFFFQPAPRVWMYHPDTKWRPAVEPFTAGDSRTVSRELGGPGTAIVKTAAAMAPDHHFVSVGFGRNSAYCSQFLPNAIYFDQLITSIRELKDKVTFGAIFMMLGITERHGTPADITGYPNCINTLVTAIRTEVGAPGMPLLLTDYEMTSTGSLAATSAFARSIIPEIQKVPTTVTNSAIVATDGLNLVDDHHFELDAHKIWVERAFKIMTDKGWFRWGAASTP